MFWMESDAAARQVHNFAGLRMCYIGYACDGRRKGIQQMSGSDHPHPIAVLPVVGKIDGFVAAALKPDPFV